MRVSQNNATARAIFKTALEFTVHGALNLVAETNSLDCGRRS